MMQRQEKACLQSEPVDCWQRPQRGGHAFHADQLSRWLAITSLNSVLVKVVNESSGGLSSHVVECFCCSESKRARSSGESSFRRRCAASLLSTERFACKSSAISGCSE